MLCESLPLTLTQHIPHSKITKVAIPIRRLLWDYSLLLKRRCSHCTPNEWNAVVRRLQVVQALVERLPPLIYLCPRYFVPWGVFTVRCSFRHSSSESYIRIASGGGTYWLLMEIYGTQKNPTNSQLICLCYIPYIVVYSNFNGKLIKYANKTLVWCLNNQYNIRFTFRALFDFGYRWFYSVYSLFVCA